MNSMQYAAGEALLKDADKLAERITDRQYELQPELDQKFGQSGRIRTKQDSLYSLNFLAESVMMRSPVLFTNYVSWLKTLLKGYRVTDEDIRINLLLIKEMIEEYFEYPDKELVLEYLELGLIEVELAEPSPKFVREELPYYTEAKLYLDQLLSGNRLAAAAIVEDMAEDHTPIKDIYTYIFQMTQYEIGRLWQIGEITVAQEHFCTAATQANISRLYPYWLTNSAKGHRIVSACVGNEQHEIGLRMLTDQFEMEGWDTYYLGANVPNPSLIDSLVKYKADVLALSATMTYHVHLVRELIVQVRNHPSTARVKILVGGMPFNTVSMLWKEVGADGYAEDAKGAIALANRLISAK
ncbi:Methanogenic corrinoid protein MtbC1 [Paenibacillus sp. PDC88]|nr:cobalamin-dependent protein [Paenibacillus sp. PDC88]SDW18412.1 Methanogenic corrinoid protein MtbC1 [Paenibacillus sp. PDC88]